MSEPAQESYRDRPKISGWRGALLLFLIPIAIHLYMHLVLSRSKVYEQVHLGMRFDDAQELFRKESLECVGPGFTSPVIRPDGAASCRFEDPWRNYLIVFNTKTQEVVREQVTYKSALYMPSPVVRYLFGRVRL